MGAVHAADSLLGRSMEYGRLGRKGSLGTCWDCKRTILRAPPRLSRLKPYLNVGLDHEPGA